MYKIQKITGLLFILFAVQLVFASNGVDEKMLIKMNEEEKMSYDLYSEFYQRWQLDVFDNVRESEFIHVQRIQELMDKYNITYSGSNTNIEKGKYSDKELQKLYDDYTVKGCISDICALNTAALMEEHDVIDLRERIKNQSDEYVIKVFTQLEKATENHLKAFVKNLKQAGVEYTPQVLSQNDYDAIVNPVKEKGTASTR